MNIPSVRSDHLLRRLGLGALVLGVVVVSACDWILDPGERSPRTEITELPRELTSTELQVLSSSNRFGFELLGKVLEAAPDETHFLSPLSAALVLAMILNGADGHTHDVIRSTLRIGDVPESEINVAFSSLIDLLGRVDPTVSFQLANGIWYRDGVGDLLDDYVARVEEHFGAAVAGLDFNDPAASDMINAWVRDVTNGRIDEMAPRPIPYSWVAVVMNAIYFDADWTWQFDRDSTRTEPFHLVGGATRPVPMMQQRGDFPHHTNEAFRAVELPYGGEAYAMTLIVPRGHHTVTGVLADLADGGWADLVGNLVAGEVTVALPRFELRWERVLNGPLAAMGMGPAFHAGDWSRMFISQPELSEVRQKSYVRVDEEGTEAAAVTRAVFTRSGPRVIRADRPFLFVIRERLSGAVLFMGAYMAPPD
jgi:serine protease inhibitor